MTDSGKKGSSWKTYNFRLVDGLTSAELSSQSSLKQLLIGEVRIAVATIVVLERGFSKSSSLNWVKRLLPILDQRRLDVINKTSYFDLLQDEIAHLLNDHQSKENPEWNFNLVNSYNEIQPNKLNIILAIEGGFALLKDGYDIISNLQSLKRRPFKFLYMTLIHMTVIPEICNHAFANMMAKQEKEFIPQLYGISQKGYEVISTAYNKLLGNRILIDIKHMSLISRKQFYKFRVQRGFQKIPIIASHVGLTGISYEPESINKFILPNPIAYPGYVIVKYNRPEGLRVNEIQTYFNPCSINLYDEEIRIIVDSDGLIGLNMDQKILGVDFIKGEYFSRKEFVEVTGKQVGTMRSTNTDESLADDHDVLDPTERKSIKIIHLYHLCNQILHAVAVGGPDTWKHLCIGSDFDGMINPINCFKNAKDFKTVESLLNTHLPSMIKAAEEANPGVQFRPINIEAAVRGIMYDNAVNFLRKHF